MASKTNEDASQSGTDVNVDGDVDKNVDVVLPYLKLISQSIDALSSSLPSKANTSPPQDNLNPSSDHDSDSDNAEYFLDRIARNLLFHACDPMNLSQPVPHILTLSPLTMDVSSSTTSFPSSSSPSSPAAMDDDDANENSDEKKEEKKKRYAELYHPLPARIKNRTDALRNIYRTMAPIALDVASRVSAIVVTSSYNHTSADVDVNVIATNVFVLFSIWLPIAPQISQIVMDLFAWEEFQTCPLEYTIVGASSGKKNDGDNDSAMDMDMDVDEDIQKYGQDAGASASAVEKRKYSTEYYKSVAVLSEAAYQITKFFAERGDHVSMKGWWEWTRLFGLLGYRNEDGIANSDEGEGGKTYMNMEVDMDNDVDVDVDPASTCRGWADRPYSYQEAIRWFAARAIGYLLNLTPTSRGVFVRNMGLENEMVPWVPHPWIVIDEEVQTQNNQLRGVIQLASISRGEIVEIQSPTPLQIRQVVNLPSSLVHLGDGIVLPRKKTVHKKREGNSLTHTTKMEDANNVNGDRQGLIMTETTSRNLAMLGTALCSDPYPPPILVCGPRGSGKSSLIRELAHYCSGNRADLANNNNGGGGDHELLELHVDEETDSKTLLGSYAATDIPGEFTWRPGALTSAVRSGKWVLLEDVESCPAEIQAALVKLFEDRVLPLGIGKSEKCHPNFRMFGTCTTGSMIGLSKNRRLRKGVTSAGSGGKRLIHPGLWRKVHVDPLPYSELQIVSRDLFPNLPEAVSDAALNVLRKLDKSGRIEDVAEGGKSEEKSDPYGTLNIRTPILGNGRHSSVRDLVKLLSRISSNVHFEPGATFCTESQRMLCMAESFDIFAGWCPCRHLRKDFVTLILAPIWGISVTAGIRYIEDRQPQTKIAGGYVEVGRSTIRRPLRSTGGIDGNSSSKFVDTNYSLRLMESAGVCIAQNEPTLLVGETGCGKTTVIQRLASLSGHELVVQNLSLQTDSTDLLGGYRPLEIRHIARRVYTDFVQLFVSSFSKSQNTQFLDYVTAAYEKGQWKRLSQCFQRAAKMGLDKVKQQEKARKGSPNADLWLEFKRTSERFEKQRVACDTGLAFVFTEGALVDAIRSGKWVLLDEINLASSETLERLCGLLDDAKGSVTLTEKGDSEALERHSDFRIFAAMNPATDSGKKDLPSSLRSRFTEIYVDELIDPIELRSVAARYLSGVIAPSETPLEHTESVISSVDVYLKCRQLSEQTLIDGSGQRPRYTLRTMCRALNAACNLISEQRFSVKRALLEGFELGFEGCLDMNSRMALKKLLSSSLGEGLSKKDLEHPGRRPGSKSNMNDYVLAKPFWLKTGLMEMVDWSDASSKSKRSRFVLTPSMTVNLRRLTRAVASGPWPILLEGPTSAGKTTMVEYLAARCGHRCVRINNHEHTDVQEYTGSYASDPNGKLCFREGILVQALRKGHWVILDELNLAPSEVLEALNRLLDDNRELYLPEINEVVKPHPSFRLFATQNPSGAYGGRKPLSRAFRNRFVEMHVGDIPEQEMVTILELRCKCPPSHAKLLVKVMSALRKRRSKSSVFRGKDGLITPRDLLRWAERKVTSKQDLAMQGWMLLAERLRDEEEKSLVKTIIEEHMKVDIDCDGMYYGNESEARRKLSMIAKMKNSARDAGLTLEAIAPTKSILRLLTLVERCVEQKEAILLVGDTGCGKTTVVQILSVLLDRDLQIVNCHASTETSDLLGGLRPLRGRKLILQRLVEKMKDVVDCISCDQGFGSIVIPQFLVRDDDSFPENAANLIAVTAKKISAIISKNFDQKTNDTEERLKSNRCKKRRKMVNGDPDEVSSTPIDVKRLKAQLKEVEQLFQQHASLFEWVDGPLVDAMRKGDLFLLDEMSLADDAVLERLNSVLEPSRTLVLAEKGGDLSVDENSSESTEIKAHEDFRVFATMNPGGDFGKRELSPALRSRFTEIWVPSVTDSEDIDLVLQQTLNASFEKYHIHYITSAMVMKVKDCMLEYVTWFNNDICSKPMSTCADFVLSLRDVLAWARFIAETVSKSQNFGIWSAYAHGASLMHLDGLGLGTGLSHEDASDTKKMAKKYLSSQIPTSEGTVAGFEDEYDDIDDSALCRAGKFGINPFVINMGQIEVPEKLGFKLSAPTTGMNLRRVLRAMQISKPILLEGSPGVGKTSLISALARASGHTLVRINLSEQTDISDLMGSDLPMPEESTDENGNSSSGGSFKWCDGALLKAIKNGHWVLLDELNLASQSVLEGLNSCLDHRASVYIPELGETFACPSTFRIFAAQNPLAQGGGRKGLPKSFLNRFTKVYVEALTKDDLQGIVSAKFPILSPSVVENIVRFNVSIQRDIENRKYGQLGSPWEFNLRDVFRWCDLISYNFKTSGIIDVGSFSDTIYMQRLRSKNDRLMLTKRYEDCFGNIDCIRVDPTVKVQDDSVHIGIAALERNKAVVSPSDSVIFGTEPSLPRHLVQPMEAVALCVQMSWPCLIVGEAASGKSTILKSLAESCNRQLEEVALTPSSDVNELIGCFEQVDAAEVEARLLECLKNICNHACLTLTKNDKELRYLSEISSLFHSLMKQLGRVRVATTDPVVINKDKAFNLAQRLISKSRKAMHLSQEFNQACGKDLTLAERDLSSFDRKKNTKNDAQSVHFRWFDGVLVKALEMGYWLHLENVNFCPSSVLDRLNPLMETDGELVLTECGIKDDENGVSGGTSRVVKPHPNFRLFLSMNPTFGEVSRAMRNRCIEVSLLSPDVSDAAGRNNISSSVDILDGFDAIWLGGIRSSKLAKSLLTFQHNEFYPNDTSNEDCQPTRSLRECVKLAIDSFNRGFVGDVSLKRPQQIAYEIHHEEMEQNRMSVSCIDDPEVESMVESIRTRHLFERVDTMNQTAIDARLLKPFSTGSPKLPLGLTSFRENEDITVQRTKDLHKFAPLLGSNDSRFDAVRSQLLANYVEKSNSREAFYKSSYFEGYCKELAYKLHFIAQVYFEETKDFESTVTEFSRITCTDRLAQILDENEVYNTLQRLDDESNVKDLSVIELSYCVHENKIDRSNINCTIIPILYPLFLSLDSYFNSMKKSDMAYSKDMELMDLIRAVIASRDWLWRFLKKSYPSNTSYLGFDEAGFLVQWNWLKKRMHKFHMVGISLMSQEVFNAKRNMDLVFASIDRAAHIHDANLRSLSSSFWKLIGHPLVPAKQSDFVSICDLRNTMKDFALLNDADFGYLRILSGQSANMSVSTLFDRQHNALVFTPEIKSEALTALCMAHWATTDEINASTRSMKMGYDTGKVSAMLLQRLESSKEKFSIKLRACTVDVSINTVENKLDLDDLEALREVQASDASSDEFLQGVLTHFGKMQISQIVEFVCIREEEWLVDNLARVVRISDDELMMRELHKALAPRMQEFIDTVMTKTIWPVSDLRPYQSILWVLDSSAADAQSVRRLFTCYYSTLIDTLSRHHWCNSYNDLNSVSETIASPSFWNPREEEIAKSIENPITVAGLAYCSGVPRSKQNVMTESLFRLQGLDHISNRSSQNIPYFTLENQNARVLQANEVARFLARDHKVLSQNSTNLETILYLAENMLGALRKSFDNECDFESFQQAAFPENGSTFSFHELQNMMEKCHHQTLAKLFANVLMPLLSILNGNGGELSQEELALATIYIGILRFHLSLPASPLDPGKKPAAKVDQWDQYLLDVGARLVTMRMEHGLLTGNFEPDNEGVTLLMNDLSHGYKKRSVQEKKRVQRPANALPFYDLFREVHHFASTIASPETILNLLEDIQETGPSSTTRRSSKEKEANWQSSVVSFLNQISMKYSFYEDVTAPFKSSLGMIQKGLRCLSHSKLFQQDSSIVTSTKFQDQLLQYPNVNFCMQVEPSCLQHISMAFQTANHLCNDELQNKKLSRSCQFAVLLSSLSNLAISQGRDTVDQEKFLETISWIFQSILDAWKSSTSSDASDLTDETEEERMERQFREMFPDHAKSFRKIIEAVEAEEHGEDLHAENDSNENDNEKELIIDSFTIAEDQVEFLCDLHRELFPATREKKRDTLRVKAFISTYVAAGQLNNAIVLGDSIHSENHRLASHSYALGLNTKIDVGSSITFQSYMTSGKPNALDFHKDANPAEVMKADLPLRALLIRISQLMRAFPGNSILIAIGQVVEKMRQLDLKRTSLGKMLTGLEVILKKAQEWEQHASERVALGESLRKVSSLVAQWRKLELQSWSYLLNVRDTQHELRAKKHWMRLYSLIILDADKSPEASSPECLQEEYRATCCFPKWVWKGCTSILTNTAKKSLVSQNDEAFVELFKVLDTFILTSGIGQFHERLKLLDSFSRQLRLGCDVAKYPHEREVAKATALSSLVEHYSQFSSLISASKEILRKPIETKLKNEVKLAKWDEQSYYALAETAEKSHRKLMMIIRDYEIVLDTNVAKILEEHFMSGIRSHSEVGAGAAPEPVTEMPSKSSMFPDLQTDGVAKDENQLVMADSLICLREMKTSWTTIDEGLAKNDKYIVGMKKYRKKMDKLFEARSECHASLGSDIVCDICESIFDRIEVLREKGTKQMKQRALVDLFKILKKQGYSSMKWSVPREIREMVSILQMKSPSSSELNPENSPLLEGAEGYFRKCTVEISRLRSEVQMMGSAYMSKREMDLMIGFSEHGLFMLCQQRSNIAKVIYDLRSAFNLLQVLDKVHAKLPNEQTVLTERVLSFDRKYNTVLETLRQTFLMAKTISSLTDMEKYESNDVISMLEGYHSQLDEVYKPFVIRELVTHDDEITIKTAKRHLESVYSGISSCEKKIRQTKSLPHDIFIPSMEVLRSAIDCSIFCETSNQITAKTSDEEILKCISNIVQNSLLAAQVLHDSIIHNEDDEDGGDPDETVKSLWENHSQILKEWNGVNLHNLVFLLRSLIEGLRCMDSNSPLVEELSYDSCKVVLKILDECQLRLAQCLVLYRNSAKFEYVKLRLFRMLVAKGFCADDVEDGGDADGEGGDGNMKFEDDVEGTGMGEGEGKNDVTDQIENEEQLLGLQGDEENKNQEEQRQLGEDEAETGMEMENDFDGEMFDVPDKQEDDKNDQGSDNEEELDREMGDGSDPNEQVVDEKMWDEDDDDDEPNQKEEEKFEQDSKVSGEALQDELRTKEDDEEGTNDDKGDDNPEKASEEKHDDQAPKNNGDDDDQGAETKDDEINEDFEDNYEDRHDGVEVRNEEDGMEQDGEGDNEDDAMDLNDDMNLDDGESVDGEETGGQMEEEQEIDDENDDNSAAENDGNHEAEQKGEEDEDDVDMESEVQNAHQTLGEDDQLNAEDDKMDEEKEEDDGEPENHAGDDSQKYEDAHGVSSKDGADSVKRPENEEDAENEEAKGDDDEEDEENGAGEGEKDEKSGGAGQSDATSGEIQDSDQGAGSKPSSTSMDAPNPFRDPGDAEKFWHKKLNVISDAQDEEADESNTNESNNEGNDDKNPDGDFEFTSKDQENSTQVLSGVAEDDAPQLEQEQEHQSKSNDIESNADKEEDNAETQMAKRQNTKKDKSSKLRESSEEEQLHGDSQIPDEDAEDEQENDVEMEKETHSESTGESDDDDANDIEIDNKVVTDLEQLQMRDQEERNFQTEDMVEEEVQGGISHEEAEEARARWSHLQAETNSLSRRLCEKLRLVMEPLVASKLRGDYRTGKRINMKRVIGYIASGYRKDKIWLRRTKPGKRDYRVLLAVDDSESMQNGAGDMALVALATLANGMSQLEIGELGVASFGEEMKLLHPFHAPFTSSSGVDLISNFKFTDKRTRTALCVESALAALELQSNSSSSMQLVFIISDGRIERDGRERLRRIVREMTEKNILLVMIIVEGNDKGKTKMKDSIVNMKEVSFVNGKPKVKHFIDDYPFPYYMVLQDMHTLPEVLGDALKQWFEMMAQNQSQG